MHLSMNYLDYAIETNSAWVDVMSTGNGPLSPKEENGKL